MLKILEYSSDVDCGCDDFYRFEKMQDFALTGDEGRSCKDEAEFVEKFQEHPAFINWAELVKDIKRAEFYDALNTELKAIKKAIAIDLQRGCPLEMEVTADKIMQYLLGKVNENNFAVRVVTDRERIIIEKEGRLKNRVVVLPSQQAG